VRAGTARGAIRLRGPAEIARTYPNTIIGRSIRLVEEVRRALLQLGVRAAEDIVVENERTVVELARLLVAIVWDKLGLRADERNTLLKVLQAGGSI